MLTPGNGRNKGNKCSVLNIKSVILGVTIRDNREVRMSRYVTLKKWRMESILSIPTNGLYNAIPILMRYNVRFTF